MLTQTLKQQITGVRVVYVLYCRVHNKSPRFLVITFYITLKLALCCHLSSTERTEQRQPGYIQNTAGSARSKRNLECLFVCVLFETTAALICQILLKRIRSVLPSKKHKRFYSPNQVSLFCKTLLNFLEFFSSSIHRFDILSPLLSLIVVPLPPRLCSNRLRHSDGQTVGHCKVESP